MKKLVATAFSTLLRVTACGGSGGDAKEPDDEKGSQAQGGGDAGPDGGGTKGIPAVACDTSDDCDDGLICVDDECAIAVPHGFY